MILHYDKVKFDDIIIEISSSYYLDYINVTEKLLTKKINYDEVIESLKNILNSNLFNWRKLYFFYVFFLPFFHII